MAGFHGFGVAGTANNAADSTNWGTTNQNTGVSYDELYDRLHLLRVTSQLVYDKYAQARFVPANAGVKQQFAFRYDNLAPASQLTEGVLPTESSITRTRVSYAVAQYGAFSKYSDQLDLFDVDSIKSQFTDIHGDQAALTMDCVVRDVDVVSSCQLILFSIVNIFPEVCETTLV